MRSKLFFICVLLLATILIGSYQNCLNQGTDTGNPFHDPPSPELSNYICQKFSSCFGLIEESCQTELLTAANLTTGLGLDIGQYPDLKAVNSAVSNGTLSESQEKFYSCASAISDLACSSALVVNSYDSASPDDFSEAYYLLQATTACLEIYD